MSIDPTAADAEIACVANMWVFYKILASLGFSIFQGAVRRQAKAWFLEDIQATNRVYTMNPSQYDTITYVQINTNTVDVRSC